MRCVALKSNWYLAVALFPNLLHFSIHHTPLGPLKNKTSA
jgi:hypothetical protein